MNFMIAITNESGRMFSGVKTSSPKVLNKMKELCSTYEKTFSSKFKVSRFIQTSKGLKKC